MENAQKRILECVLFLSIIILSNCDRDETTMRSPEGMPSPVIDITQLTSGTGKWRITEQESISGENLYITYPEWMQDDIIYFTIHGTGAYQQGTCFYQQGEIVYDPAPDWAPYNWRFDGKDKLLYSDNRSPDKILQLDATTLILLGEEIITEYTKVQ